MPYFHLTLASRGRATLFPLEAELRAGVDKLAAVSGKVALLYSIVDDHLHDLVDVPSLELAKRLCGSIGRSVGSVARVPFASRDVRPVESRSHLKSLVRYILTQPEHHGLSVASALWSGSSFLDLAGARWIPALDLRLKEALPRLQWFELLEMLGLPRNPLLPVDDGKLTALGLERIADAAASALNVAPDLAGRCRRSLLARRCAVVLARRGGIRLVDAARRLQWAERSVARYANAPLPAAAQMAVRRRLALEELAGAASSR